MRRTPRSWSPRFQAGIATLLVFLASAAAFAEETGIVTASSLNVRQGPSTSEAVLFHLDQGAEVAIARRRGDWCEIRTSEGGRDRAGWVHSRYMRIETRSEPIAWPDTREKRLEFIRDHDRSALDLLGDPGAALRRFSWHRNDFPGSPEGPNEGEARRLSELLSGALAERRVNTGPHRLPFDWDRVEPNLVAVPEDDAGRRLFRLAAESFVAMREAAAADGVRLILVSAARSPEHQKRLAAANPNPNAVAQGVSAHNYGLAIDLAMSPGADREFEEVTTRPYSNMIEMRGSPVYKWMFLEAAAHGWYPYHNEPWHWEYNPPGLAEKFPG